MWLKIQELLKQWYRTTVALEPEKFQKLVVTVGIVIVLVLVLVVVF